MTLRGTTFWIVCAISCTVLNRLKSQPQLVDFFTVHPSKGKIQEDHFALINLFLIFPSTDFHSLLMVSSIFVHREIHQLTWNLSISKYLLGYGPFSGDYFFLAIFLSFGIFPAFRVSLTK